MPAGGARPNSGRPKGAATQRNQDLAAKYLSDGGLLPLDFFMSILRSEHELDINRQIAARDAAPYLHPKLASAEMAVTAKLVIDVNDKLDNEDDGGGLA